MVELNQAAQMNNRTTPALTLTFVGNPGLPRLGWMAQVDRASCEVVVTHGQWVEVRATGYVEGIWDAPFEQFALDRSPTVFGSGGVVRGDRMTFVSSTSTTDYLYWAADDRTRGLLVSNSLPLLLARLDDELDPDFESYDKLNNSIMQGIERYAREIPTRRRKVVRRLMHWNLTVTPDSVSESSKLWTSDFQTYRDYAAYLYETFRRLAANARDGARARPMAIYSTQSKGYDTTAANAVARNFGVDKVFTVRRAKAKGYYADEKGGSEGDDDGTDICSFFGLECVAIDRRAIERDFAEEYLYYASMHENGDFNLHQISAHVVKPSVLITGCLGEIWASERFYADHPGLINPDLMRADLGSHGLTEVRLKAGYVQVAFPYIGARWRESIFRITHSAEMDPWRLSTAYDRPIARRLAEEAGLARNAFGQTKMASVLEFPLPAMPLAPDLQIEFLRFLVESRLLRPWQVHLLPLARRWNAIVSNTSPRRHAWNYYLQRFIGKVLRRPFAFPPVMTRLNASIFCFSVNRRAGEYKSALCSGPADDSERRGLRKVGGRS